jgi:hypothetical protein
MFKGSNPSPRIPRSRPRLLGWLILIPALLLSVLMDLVLLILIAALFWMISGCASGTPQTVGHLTVRPGVEVMQECPPPPPPLPQGATDAEMVANHVVGMKAYHKCVEHNRAKINWINKTTPND